MFSSRCLFPLPLALTPDLSSRCCRWQRVSAHDDDDNEDGEADGAPEPAPSAPTAANLSATAACAAPSATTEPCAASSVASSSSITSSAVSVQTDKAVPVSEAPAIPQPPTAEPAVPEPAAPKVATNDDEPKSESDVATELMKMGFEPKSVELVLEKNGNAASPAALLEACTGDLVQLSEWDSMLSDLEEVSRANPSPLETFTAADPPLARTSFLPS